MASVPFTGNATITAGNATSLLAVSSLYFAGNSVARANGARLAYFETQLSITPSDPANFTLMAASNSTSAANLPPGAGLKGVSGGFMTVSPAWVLSCVNNGNFSGANISVADAGNIYVATSANQTLNIAGY